jgi:acetolactate synthase-1/3 small subunit
MMKHTISVLVKNRPRVLTRIAGLFARRDFNIDSLTVSTTEKAAISRMTIVVDADDATLLQICKQLSKLHDVQQVMDHTGEPMVEREICLVKLRPSRQQRSEVFQLAEVFRGDVVDIGTDLLTVQVVGGPAKVDAFVLNVEEFNIVEMVRTGKVVLTRGA